MNKLFKAAMFFTSFIPLWITIVFLDIMSIIDKMNTNFNNPEAKASEIVKR